MAPTFDIAIPSVSHFLSFCNTEGIGRHQPPKLRLCMDKPVKLSPPEWGLRIRDHVRRSRTTTWAKIARKMDRTEGALRHWCNGTREITLSQFLELCAEASADPVLILIDTARDKFKGQLLFFYDGIRSQDRRDALVGTANRLYVEEHPLPSIANPFGYRAQKGAASRIRGRAR